MRRTSSDGRKRSLPPLLGATLGTAAALVILIQPAPGAAAEFVVQAANFQFVAPGGGSSVTIRVGDRVTWVASGDPHTVTSGSPGAVDGRFRDHPASAGLLENGDSFSATFSEAGTFPYFCEIHPEQMTGLVIVVAAASPVPTPSAVPTASPTRTPAPSRRPRPTLTPSSTLESPTPGATPTGTAPASSTARPSASPGQLEASASPATIESPTESPPPPATPISKPTTEPTGSESPSASDGPSIPLMAAAAIAAAIAAVALLFRFPPTRWGRGRSL